MAEQITASYALRQESSFDALESADHTNYLLTQSEDRIISHRGRIIQAASSGKSKKDFDDRLIERKFKTERRAPSLSRKI